MQVFSVGLFWVFFSAQHLSDPNTDSETESDKVNQIPHTQAKPPSLGVISSHAENYVRAMDRKHECQPKGKGYSRQIATFP